MALAVEAYSERQALSPRQGYALSLALEELVTNVVKHGYAGRDTAGESMTVTARTEAGRVFVAIEDGGVAFDPTAAPEVDTDLDIEERKIGGLGVHLVRTLVEQLSYRRQDGRNILTFQIAPDAAAEAGDTI